MRIIIGLLTVSLATELAMAAPPAEGPPPVVTHHVAKVTADGNLWLRNIVWRPVVESKMTEEPFTVDVPVIENGKKKFVKETRMRLVNTSKSKYVSEPIVERVSSEVRFFDLGGKELDRDAVAGKLRSEAHILISSKGKLPPADVLQIFQPGTFVLVLQPRDGSPAAAAPDANTADQPGEPPEFTTPPPQRPPPRLTFASVSGGGRLKLSNRCQVPFESTVMRTIEKPDGTDQQVPEIIHGTDTQTRSRELSADIVSFYDTEGKSVSTPKAAERLKQETLLLESIDSSLPDPFYLRFVKKGVLIMTMPAERPKDTNPAPPVAAPAAAKKPGR